MDIIQYCLIVLLFIANLFADTAATAFDKGRYATANPCPRLSASYFSKLVYTYAVPLMWAGTIERYLTEILCQLQIQFYTLFFVPFEHNFLLN
jgi:hypothetical protein